MFCKNCGAQLAGTENNCSNCGAPVEKESKPIVPEIVQTPEQGHAPAPNPFVVHPVVEEPAEPVQPNFPIEPTQLLQSNPDPTSIPEAVMPAPPVAQPSSVSLDQMMNQTPAPQPVEPAPVPVNPTPVVSEPVMNQPAPVAPAPQEPATPAIQSMPEPATMQPAPQPMTQPVPQPMPNQVAPASTGKKNNNTKTAIIIGGVFLLAIVIVSALSGMLGGGGNTSNGTTENSPKTQEYAGYMFSIPASYTSSILGTDLMIDGSEKGYIINIDYTNTYEQYKEYYTIKYQDANGEAINTIGGREYLIFRFQDTSNREISEFFTQLDATTTFAGVITHRDGSTITIADYEYLTGILNTVQRGTQLVQKGDTLDSGKGGYIDFSARKLNFFR